MATDDQVRMTRSVPADTHFLRPGHLMPEYLPFPTETQLDLLKAALLPAEQAATAWRRWKARRLQFETLDQPSGRMLTQVWANRDAAAISAKDRAVLKRLYHRTLASNAAELSGALEIIPLLVDAGIPVLIFKGADLIAIYPEHLGLRPISDVDVLIPEADGEHAIALLTGAGCEVKGGHGMGPFGVHHSRPYECPNGSALDVHRWAFKTGGDDRSMFKTAREATLLGHPVLIPSATECLVTAIATAFSGLGLGAPMKWIADAMLLFEIEGDAIEWDILLERARRPGLTLGLTAGLDLLAREFGAPVPADVLTELRRRKVSWRERGAYWARINDPPWVLNGLLFHLEQHRTQRLNYEAGVPRDFLGYLAQSPRVRTGKRRDVFKYCVLTAFNAAFQGLNRLYAFRHVNR